MELVTNYKLPFLSMNIVKSGTKLETSIYKKPTNTGLLLHFDSHVDQHYKKGLLKTMLNTAYRLSLKWKLFTEECEALKLTFSNLHYPSKLIDATINQFITNIVADILPSDTTTIFPWSCFCFLSLNRKLWSTQGDSYKILVLYVKSVSLYIQSQSSKKVGNTLNI